MRRFSIRTLGCRVNQYESEAIGKYLTNHGLIWEKAENNPDVFIINTCTVTGKASVQSRNAIRSAIREFPGARIIVTGCYAQTEAQVIRAIEGVDAVIGHQDKLRIPEMILSVISREDMQAIEANTGISCTDTIFRHLPVTVTDSRTRPYLKIQDGCNAFCTYCIVPHARGRSRSMPEADVITQIRNLHAEGAGEVVLTGIHLGNYGKDLNPPTTLTGLIRKLLETGTLPKIRLSSIEPGELDSELIRLAATRPDVLCPHFHIPLQSGDDTILRRMGRPYSTSFFREKIMEVVQSIPGCAIGLDTLIGFPGETEKEFQNTYDLVAGLPVAYLHVFPYSPRKGTPAAEYENQVPKKIMKDRAARMRALSARKQNEFYRSFTGKTMEVQVTGGSPDAGGLWTGLTPNYLNVTFSGPPDIGHQTVRVRIETHAGDDRLLGTLLP